MKCLHNCPQITLKCTAYVYLFMVMVTHTFLDCFIVTCLFGVTWLFRCAPFVTQLYISGPLLHCKWNIALLLHRVSNLLNDLYALSLHGYTSLQLLHVFYLTINCCYNPSYLIVLVLGSCYSRQGFPIVTWQVFGLLFCYPFLMYLKPIKKYF